MANIKCTIPVRVARRNVLHALSLYYPEPESRGPREGYLFFLRFVLDRSSFGPGGGRALRAVSGGNKPSGRGGNKLRRRSRRPRFVMPNTTWYYTVLFLYYTVCLFVLLYFTGLLCTTLYDTVSIPLYYTFVIINSTIPVRVARRNQK